jgi:ADP-heptose:LPS heptosyltransferase
LKVLIIRMMGLGDVASILIPAVNMIHQQHTHACIDVLTYGAGVELMSLVPTVNAVLAVSAAQWPGDIDKAIPSFIDIAQVVISQNYDLIINLDTWFMPCFLARLLKDSGANVQGNFINLSVDALIHKIQRNTLTQSYFQTPNLYLVSSYPNMADWSMPWWNQYPNITYPEFYLQHCCGFEQEVNMSLSVEPDLAFKLQAETKPIIALSLSGSKASKQYAHGEVLQSFLEQSGFFVWGRFDGSVPMQATLARLKVTDLLITVATSTQWLAKLVECPSLMIPGALPPSVLGAELVVEKQKSCQYCYQSQCAENINFACMDIPPEQIIEKTRQYFQRPSSLTKP